jgi:CRISPR-associated endoribonuclease Cas6
MLTSLILTLKSPKKATLPASLGRAGQAALLRLIQDRNPNQAEELHDQKGFKPYTVSNLVLGRRAGGSLRVEAGQEGWLRFTGLNQTISQYLTAVAADPPNSVELDGHQFTMTGTTLDPAQHPWAGQASYQDLAAPFLLGSQAKPSPKIRMEFVSPTTFRSNRRYVPLPLPELVFGSLLDRWQAFAPIALHPEMRRFAEEAMVLSRYQIRTRGVPHKRAGQEEEGGRGGYQIGFTGQVTFTALNRDRYWLNVLHLLAAFAFYSGVGYQTGTGLGQTRPV